jgi:hypothetical protein
VLDAAASLAAGADLHPPGTALDVAGAPLPLGQRPNGARYSHPTHRAVAVIGKILRQLQAWMLSAG